MKLDLVFTREVTELSGSADRPYVYLGSKTPFTLELEGDYVLRVRCKNADCVPAFSTVLRFDNGK